MIRSTVLRRLASTAIPAIAMALAAPALAQDASGEEEAANEGNDIVVTATLRDSSLQDVPFSINAQTGEDLARANATTLEAAARNVAGLNIQNLGPGQSQVSIRGVSAGQVVRDQPGVKEQVGVYLDESVISLSLFTPDLDLFDLNRLETLRGPQGTLFGAGSIGGTIRYITNQPRLGRTEGALEANLNLVDGDSLGAQVRGAINLPLGDTIALRAVGYYTRFGGYIDALGPAGDDDINDGRRYGGRIAVTFQPSESLTITPRVVYQETIYDGFNRQEVFNLYANPNTTTRPAITFDERQQYLLLKEEFRDQTLIADLTTRADLGGVALTLVGSYINRDILVSRDASALTGSVSVDLGYPTAGVLLPSNLRDTTDLESWTGEARLASDNDSALQWVVGLFYANVNRDYAQRLPTPGYDAFTDARFGAGTSAAVANGFPLQSPYNADIPYDIEQFAVFGEASYTFADTFTVTAGGRYYDFSEVRQFISGGLFANGDNNTDETSSNGFTPRFLLSWRATDNVTVNAQASRGFRLGGVNDPLNIPLCSGGAGGVDALTYGNRPSYDDETSWNYEVGIKTQGRGFTFNAAAFYNDITNLQMTADAGSCSSRVVFNVPSAHTTGLEFELSVEPVDGLDLALSGSILEAEFDSSVTTTAGAVIAGFRDGNRLPSTPEFTLAASADYSFALSGTTTGFLRGSVQHVGSRFTQASDQEGNPRSFVSGLAFGGATGTVPTVLDLQLPSYELVDISAGIEWDDGTSVTLYVTNLFDENALLSFDRERGGRARLGFSTNPPRTFGVTVRKAF